MTWREGELLFQQAMRNKGYIIEDVSQNGNYFDKDIDCLITSPTTGITKSFEIKTDSKINTSGNLYLEIVNMNSKQWNYDGWWLHCEADYLVYIDAINSIFYIIPLLELRERVKKLPKRIAQCGNDSIGQLVSLKSISDITQIL